MKTKQHRSACKVLKATDHVPVENWSYFVLLIALSSLPFISSLNGDFVFDDAESVVRNPIVNGEKSITKILESDFWGRPIASPSSHKSFRPVTTFTFWLNWKLHGPSTQGYHLVNIFLHTACSVLVYFSVRLISLGQYSLAGPAAILFAVHPVHTEAIANITGRAELLSALFFLLALIIFQTRRYYIGRSVFWSTLFLIPTTLSVFSKEQGITVLPFCLFLCCFRRNFGWKRTSFFLFLSTLALSVLRLHFGGYAHPKFTPFDNAAAFLPNPLWRLLNYNYLWCYHLSLLIFPVNLCFDYSMGCIPTITTITDERLIFVILLAVSPFVVLWGLFKLPDTLRRSSMIAIALGVLTFLPASNLLVTVGFTVAERVLYLPSIGISILAAVVYRALQRAGVNTDLPTFLIIGLAISKCYQRSSEWSTELSLYSSGLQVCPNNAKIHYNLGKVLGNDGRKTEAEMKYWEAIRLNPTYDHALNNLANLLEEDGRNVEAERLLRKAVQLKPNFASAWMNLGITLMHNNKFAESLNSFERSLQLRPLSSDCLFNLGNLYQKMGRLERAKDCWLNATSIQPDHIHAWTNLFVLLDELGNCPTVISLSSRALSHGNEHPPIYSQIGSCFAQLGHFEVAEQHFKTAIELNPNHPLYHSNLGVLYHRWQRYDEAENAYLRALQLDSEVVAVRNSLQVVRRMRRNETVFH